ncbi:MAG: cysteine peptidase family C39 domain-containing protein [Paracoccaceae bacterium]
MLRSSLFWASSVGLLFWKAPKFVLQSSRTDCGVASALTVLKFLSRPVDPVHAVDHMDPDRTGTNLDALRRYFEEQYGINARSLAVQADRVGTLKGNVILHMRQMHFVVLLKASPAGILCFDPSVGPVYFPHDDFVSLYSGYLLECDRKVSSAVNLPLPQNAVFVSSATEPRDTDLVALFILGIAIRLLECGILLCLCAALYLVLNQASFSSLMMIFVLIVSCASLLLVARRTRFTGEDKWVRKKQSRLWRGLLRTSLSGRDLNGFRGRLEKDVASAIRRGLIVSIPKQAQIPATLGTLLLMSVLLNLLSLYLSLLYLFILGCVLIVTQLGNVSVCRRSVRGSIGRYSSLSQGKLLINAAVAPEMLGEVAKWSVIGFAGFGVLNGSLSAIALMFWILTAMQIVPGDFRRAVVLAPSSRLPKSLSALVGTEVPLRWQKVVGTPDLKIFREGKILQIDGISSLTQMLQQPDLTVREQRLILADIVRHTIMNLPESERPALGPVRIFGPGQQAMQADFEHLVIAKEARSSSNLPAKRDARKSIEIGLQNPVFRNLQSCEPGDFPVFWDVRRRIPINDLKALVDEVGVACVVHLTMNRLTVVERG